MAHTTPIWKHVGLSAIRAIPFAVLAAAPIGFAFFMAWMLFCVDTLGPDPVENPTPQWRQNLGGAIMMPGMTFGAMLSTFSLTWSWQTGSALLRVFSHRFALLLLYLFSCVLFLREHSSQLYHSLTLHALKFPILHSQTPSP